MPVSNFNVDSILTPMRNADFKPSHDAPRLHLGFLCTASSRHGGGCATDYEESGCGSGALLNNAAPPHSPNSVDAEFDNAQRVGTEMEVVAMDEDNSADAVSRWALHCIQMIAGGVHEDTGAEMAMLKTTTAADSVQQMPSTIAANAIFLSPPLSLAHGSAFPLFQQMQKSKRVRTAFSACQLAKLEHAFRGSQYLVGSERRLLAKQLALSETQVKVWFQNRRTKSKRVDNGDETTTLSGRSNGGGADEADEQSERGEQQLTSRRRR